MTDSMTETANVFWAIHGVDFIHRRSIVQDQLLGHWRIVERDAGKRHLLEQENLVLMSAQTLINDSRECFSALLHPEEYREEHAMHTAGMDPLDAAFVDGRMLDDKPDAVAKAHSMFEAHLIYLFNPTNNPEFSERAKLSADTAKFAFDEIVKQRAPSLEGLHDAELAVAEKAIETDAFDAMVGYLPTAFNNHMLVPEMEHAKTSGKQAIDVGGASDEDFSAATEAIGGGPRLSDEVQAMLTKSSGKPPRKR